jgi:hypothetical protein
MIEKPLSDNDLKVLSNAHTGCDLEGVCWEAAKEIKYLRSLVYSHEQAIGLFLHTWDEMYLEDYAEKHDILWEDSQL